MGHGSERKKISSLACIIIQGHFQGSLSGAHSRTALISVPINEPKGSFIICSVYAGELFALEEFERSAAAG